MYIVSETWFPVCWTLVRLTF